MKDKINKYLLIGTVCLFLALSTVSCSLLHSVFDDKVVTTSDNVREDFPKDQIAIAPTEGVITAEQQKKLKDSGKEIVIVDRGAVKDRSLAIEVTNPNSDTLGSILDVGVQIGKIFLPGIAGLEAVGVLLSQRKRDHYGSAIRSLTPYDGAMNIGEATVSIAKALGFAHSSEASKEASSKQS